MNFESPKSNSHLAEDLTEAIGGVPTLRLKRLVPLCQARQLYLKLEACNPGGSIKEKNAVYLIKEAEETGQLLPGGTIVESSSGNFGIGLAMVGAARGYKVKIVVDAKTAPPMRRMLEAYGAELVDVLLSAADANGSMQVARMARAQEIARMTPKAWYPCQHYNPSNPLGHYLYTAQEIENAFQGAPDVIVVGISTAGQLAGLVRFFRERYPRTRFVGVDVAGSVVLGAPAHPYKMTGLGLSFVPPNFHRDDLWAGYTIRDALAFSVCHALARKEGLLLGASTGAIVAAGMNFALGESKERKILMINPDRGDRYLETVYSHDWLEKQGLQILRDQELDYAIESLRPLFVNSGTRPDRSEYVSA